jgi:hypothetical protein
MQRMEKDDVESVPPVIVGGLSAVASLAAVPSGI